MEFRVPAVVIILSGMSGVSGIRVAAVISRRRLEGGGSVGRAVRGLCCSIVKNCVKG
jgi:hypothetical protein